MKVRFTAAFDYTPSLKRQVTTAYPAGWSGTVKRECGEQAIALGKAVLVTPAEEPASHEPPAPSDPE